MSGAPITKEGKLYSKTFMGWCATQPCFFCAWERRTQTLPTKVHHWPMKGMGGARRRDDRVIPACPACHDRCHGLRVNGLGPIPTDKQDIAVAAIRSRFMEEATADEWERFTRDRCRWLESRGAAA